MEPNFSGLVIDPAKCNELSLEEKRELVHEISQWTDNAPEILRSFSRRELLQLICAEMGKERKYTGVTKPKMIDHLLRLVSEKKIEKKNNNKTGLSSDSIKNQNGFKKKRKKEQVHFATDIERDHSEKNNEKQVNILICPNLACRATLSPDDKYCKRCSCCICHHYDDNKDPSLWLVCNSDPPFRNDSCGMSCHLKCALKHERAGILKNGRYTKLDGSFYCVCCGKVNWLIRSWLKQLLIAKDARRVDVLCDRLSLSQKILKGTERYKELHNIVNVAVKKLKKEVGALDKDSAMMARGIVNRLACGAEVQKLCTVALETLDSMLSGISDLSIDADLKAPGTQALRIHFEEVSPSSVLVSIHTSDDIFEETIIGCTMWHRSSDVADYPVEPTCIRLRPDTKIKISGLSPSTEYYFKVSPFSSTKELGKWEARCLTRNQVHGNSSKYSTHNSDGTYLHGDFVSPLEKDQEMGERPVIIQADSQRGSTNSSDNNRAPKLPKSSHHNRPKVLSLEGISDNNGGRLPPPSEVVPFVSSNSVPVETPCKPYRLISSPDSANKEPAASTKESAEREYEYCVKVIRWLECEGHMEKEFRVKFLTWFSLKATAQERRVVSAFIDVLIDEPASLVAQLMDAFMDGICNKEKPVARKGFCTRLWH